jgi:hypothetical protein
MASRRHKRHGCCYYRWSVFVTVAQCLAEREGFWTSHILVCCEMVREESLYLWYVTLQKSHVFHPIACIFTKYNKKNLQSTENSCYSWNTSETPHHYLAGVLFDVISCTSYTRFNWFLRQFGGWKCLHLIDECNSDSVLGIFECEEQVIGSEYHSYFLH